MWFQASTGGIGIYSLWLRREAPMLHSGVSGACIRFHDLTHMCWATRTHIMAKRECVFCCPPTLFFCTTPQFCKSPLQLPNPLSLALSLKVPAFKCSFLIRMPRDTLRRAQQELGTRSTSANASPWVACLPVTGLRLEEAGLYICHRQEADRDG